MNTGNRNHKLHCQCSFCKAQRGERSGENHPSFGKRGKDSPNYGSKRTQEQKDKRSKSMIGENNHMYGRYGKDSANWKGEEFQNKEGYWLIWVNGKRILRARYVAEKCLQRKLKKEEIIHHINEIKDDDRPENLYLFPSQSAHAKHHGWKITPMLTSNLI